MAVCKGLARSLFFECLKSPTRCQIARIHNREKIGNRDWVGFGINGSASYDDDIAYPFPSIRFRENTNELLALREKEKGDWRKLSIEEKKILYRASFRQTLSEAEAPTGQWKSAVGVALFCVSLGLWLYFLEKILIFKPLPETYTEDWRKQTLRTMIDCKVGLINGISSKWDYEKDDWK